MEGVEPVTEDERKRRAAEYIDRVIKLNQAHGGSVPITPEQKRLAVAEAASLFSELRPAGR